MSRSSYETQARRRKAVVLSDWCRATGLTARSVIAMTPTIRRQACEDAGVNVASDKTWEVVVGLLGATQPHETFVVEGGLSNFTVECVCGKQWGVASLSREVAERSADEHVHAFDAELDPFANLPGVIAERSRPRL